MSGGSLDPNGGSGWTALGSANPHLVADLRISGRYGSSGLGSPGKPGEARGSPGKPGEAPNPHLVADFGETSNGFDAAINRCNILTVNMLQLKKPRIAFAHLNGEPAP